MLKKFAALLCAAVIAISVTGCATDTPPSVAIPTPSASLSPDHAVNFEQIATGGKLIENSNAKFLTLEQHGESVTAVLTFTQGSTLNGTTETAPEAIPAYKAYCTGSPARFVLEFSSLDNWDYDRTFELPETDDLFYAVFKQFQNNDDRFRIFFQLKQNVTFEVTEEADRLLISFTPAAESDATGYYVTADALSSFTEGAISDDMGLFPTLCADLENTILISNPFQSEAEAEEYRASLELLVASILPNEQFHIISLTGHALPEFVDSEQYRQVYSQQIVSIDGRPATLPVVLPDGMYLCSSPDGRRSVFSRQLREENMEVVNDDTVMTVEELWVMESSGKLRRLSETDFSTIEMASFSPDGRKLAILESTSEVSYLHVYDLDTGVLINLSEEGLGQITSDFIWDVLGSAIYAISGNDGLHLMKYDFTIPDETKRITVVEDRTLEDGDLAFYNGDLYFANPDGNDTGVIYKIKPEGGLRAEYTKGGSFRISPDGRTMAILESFGIGAEEEETTNNTSLKIKNMLTGEEKYLVQNRYIVSFDWAENGQLYYTEGIDDSGDSTYGFRLFRYDLSTGESAAQVDMVTADFSVTPDPSVLYLPYMYVDGQTRIRATYKLELQG